MFKRILVPLDGSPRAEQALPVAARLASASRGTVILLQVVNTPQEAVSYITLQPMATRQFVNEEQAKAEHYLQHCVEQGSLVDIPNLLMVRNGLPATTILEVIDEQAVDLVVMASHGYTGMTHWMLGSIAENVSHAAPVPVLLLREEHPLPVESQLQREDSLRILVPLDGSAQVEEIIVPASQLVMALADPVPGALHLLFVMQPLNIVSSIGRTGSIRQAKEYLRATVRRIREGSLSGPIATGRLTLTWSVSTNGADIADTIVDVAEHGQKASGGDVFGKCNVIAMAPHSANGLRRWVLGSVTERVLHRTKLPLLIMLPEQVVASRQRSSARISL